MSNFILQSTVEIGLDSLDMLEDVMEIIEQAFRLQDVE